MKVVLVDFTPNPLETVLFAYKMMKERHHETDLAKLDPKEAEWVVGRLLEDGLCGPLEFVSTVWFLDDVSRAFQQQLTRHRKFGYSIESMRVVDKCDFASAEKYLIPSNVKNREKYVWAMNQVERIYNDLIADGELVEVARGILPLNIFSPISFVANMRSLVEMFQQRSCHQVQGEFKEVIYEMMGEIDRKMSPIFTSKIAEPCIATGKCLMSVENELREQGKDPLGRLPCPLYGYVSPKIKQE